MFDLKIIYYLELIQDLKDKFLPPRHLSLLEYFTKKEEDYKQFLYYINFYYRNLLEEMNNYNGYKKKMLIAISKIYNEEIIKHKKVYESIIKFKKQNKSKLERYIKEM